MPDSNLTREPNSRPPHRHARPRLASCTILYLAIAISLPTSQSRLESQCTLYDVREVRGFDGAGSDRFGTTVAKSSSRYFLGASGADGGRGAVYMFTLSSQNQPSYRDRITPQDGSSDVGFGHSIAYISLITVGGAGTYLYVGAPYDDEAAEDAGAVYLYTVSSQGCVTLREKILPPNATGGERFGWALPTVATYEGISHVAIGAPGTDNGRGKVHLYKANFVSSPPLLYDGQLQPDSTEPNDYFGWSIECRASQIAVGAPFHESNGIVSGAAYLFRILNDSPLEMVEEYALTIPGTDFDRFGSDVAITPNSVFVGAPGSDISGIDSGAAFRFSFADMAHPQMLTPTVANDYQRFGAKVVAKSISSGNDFAVIGAPGHAESRGASFCYSVNETAASELQMLTNQNAAPGGQFGIELFLMYPIVMIGSLQSELTVQNNGSAVLYDVPSTTATLRYEFAPYDFSMGDQYGYAAAADDDTFVISAPYNSRCCSSECNCLGGAVFVHTVTNGKIESSQILWDSETCDQGRFGESVAVRGDLLVVGATNAVISEDSTTYNGAMYIYRRIAGNWVEQARLVDTENPGIAFGRQVATDGHRIITMHNYGHPVVFGFDGENWIRETIEFGNEPGEFTGVTSVAIEGDTFVIGRALGPTASALIFRFDAGVWAQSQILTPPHSYGTSYFGFCVDLDGNRLFISDPRHTYWTSTVPAPHIYKQTGAVFEYEMALNEFQLTNELLIDIPNSGGVFGKALDARGNQLLVTARSPVGSENNYILYERTDNNWQELVRVPCRPGNFTTTPIREAALADDFFVVADMTYNGTGPYQKGRVMLYTSHPCNDDCLPRGDLNADGRLDAYDVSAFVDCMTTDPTHCPCADLAPPLGFTNADAYAFAAALVAN